MKRLSAFLQRLSASWVVLIALALLLYFFLRVLPDQAAQVERYAGEVGSPDTTFGYSAADLYRMAEVYGPEGRQAYVRARFTFDLVWPLVYTAFFVTAIGWLYRRAFPAGSRWQRANLFPFLALMLDYLENGAAALVMARYPFPTPVVAELTPVFTVLKWIAVSGCALLLVWGGVGALWRWGKGMGYRRR